MGIYWILGQIIISIVAVVLIHYLYQYLKGSLTSPIEYNYKKELQEEYEKMYDALSSDKTQTSYTSEPEETAALPSMEAELTDFLESKTI